MNLKLIEAVTMEEVYATTHQMGAIKAPGLDGLKWPLFSAALARHQQGYS